LHNYNTKGLKKRFNLKSYIESQTNYEIKV